MNTFTIKFDIKKLNELKNFLQNEGCEFTSLQYAFFKATNKNYGVSFYNSGKLLIQGKDISKIVEKISNHFELNCELKADEKEEEIKDDVYMGIDESGKGDFFGPLVVAGVVVTKDLKKKFQELGIKDSKLLSDEIILKLAIQIQKTAKWSVVVISPTKYNELYAKFNNLNKLLAWGHARTIENILEKAPECTLALSDKFAKNDAVIENALMNKGKKIKLLQRIKGENDIAVAAASIIARAEFVSRMKSMSNLYKLIFPKGASDKVVECAKNYIKMYSKEKLNEVAKMHFKTAQQV